MLTQMRSALAKAFGGVCDEFLDSNNYVNHINSRFHQSKLGKSNNYRELFKRSENETFSAEKTAKNVSSAKSITSISPR